MDTFCSAGGSDMNGSYIEEDPPRNKRRKTKTVCSERFPTMLIDTLSDGSYLTELKTKLNATSKDIERTNSCLNTLNTLAGQNRGSEDSIAKGTLTYIDRLQASSKAYSALLREIKEIKKTKDAAAPSVEVPKDHRTDQKVNEHDMRRACNTCGSANYPSSTFETFLSKLFSYGERRKWSHNNFKDAMASLLEGQPHAQFRQLIKAGASFEEIISSMADEYISPVTIQDDKMALLQFRRMPLEKLTRAMARFAVLLTKTEQLFDKDMRVQRKRTEMKKTLHIIAAESAKERLRTIKMEQVGSGRVLPYEYLLREAVAAETEAMDVPNEETATMLCINSMEMRGSPTPKWTNHHHQQRGHQDVQKNQPHNNMGPSEYRPIPQNHQQQPNDQLWRHNDQNYNNQGFNQWSTGGQEPPISTPWYPNMGQPDNNWEIENPPAHTVVYKPGGPNVHHTNMNIYVQPSNKHPNHQGNQGSHPSQGWVHHQDQSKN